MAEHATLPTRTAPGKPSPVAVGRRDKPRRRLLAGLWRVALPALLATALFATPSMARHGGAGSAHGSGFARGGGGWHGHGGYGRGWYGRGWYGGGWYGGFYPYAGLGLYGYGYGYPWYFDYPYYGYGYAPAASPVAAGQYWYYCPNPAGYYPTVPSCPMQWQLVPPR